MLLIMDNKGINMTKLQKLNKNFTNTRFNSDDDYNEDSVQADQLGYFIDTNTSFKYTVPIDTDFVEPSHYRAVVQMMDNATENDLVLFKINSRGGALSGLQTLLEAIKCTEAHTVAVVVGQCASAASILLMYCDSAVVTDSANALIHHVSFWTGGKGADVLSHVQHVAKTSEKLMKEAYEGFLTEDEIKEVIGGKELYLDADEMRERFANREEYREDQFEAEQKALEQAKSPPPVTTKGKAAKPK